MHGTAAVRVATTVGPGKRPLSCLQEAQKRVSSKMANFRDALAKKTQEIVPEVGPPSAAKAPAQRPAGTGPFPPRSSPP